MKTQQVIEFYGTQTKAADALGINQASISKWADHPPILRQYQIQLATKGALKAEKRLITHGATPSPAVQAPK